MIDAFINSLLFVIGLVFIVIAVVKAILPRGWLAQVFAIAVGVWLGRTL